MKHRTWLVVAFAVLLGVGGFVYWLNVSSFGWKGGTSLEFHEGEDPSWPTRTINASHVEQHLPRFHDLLEKAYRDGVAYTSDDALIREILAYIEGVTGSIERNDNLEYRGKVFQMLLGVQ